MCSCSVELDTSGPIQLIVFDGMEDPCGVQYNDCEEFVIVNESISPGNNLTNPQLNTKTTAEDLEQALTEVLLETQPCLTSLTDESLVTNAPADLDLRREISDLNIGSAPSVRVEGNCYSKAAHMTMERSKDKEEEDGSVVKQRCSPVTGADKTGSDAAKNEDSYRLVGGGSKFYSVEDADKEGDKAKENRDKDGEKSPMSPVEKQDHMKPTESDEEVSDVDQECTVFSGVSYLGAAAINAPKSESEIQRTMSILHEQRESEMGIAVSVSIPICSQGLVVLYDAATNGVMARYSVQRILFYTRGAVGTSQASCFAFTWSHGDTKASFVFQCHVFRCHITEAVMQVSSCFAKAFERVPRSMMSSMTSDGVTSMSASMPSTLASDMSLATISATTTRHLMHVLECTMEIREGDAKGAFSVVPKDKAGFKLRAGIDKLVVITVQQVSPNAQLGYETQSLTMSQSLSSSPGLVIERCFGVLLAPGRNVKHPDMQLLEMVGDGNNSSTNVGTSCSTSAMWIAAEPALSSLNVGHSDPLSIWITIAVDIVIRGTKEPLRLPIETPVRVYPNTERFWYYSKKPLVQQFFINLKETIDMQGTSYEVLSLETSGELDKSRLTLTLSLSSLLPSPLTSQPAPPSPDEESDGDEPMLSGTGEVSRYCCEGVLENWGHVLRSWSGERPKALGPLVRMGIPEALRGEIWQRLVDADRYDHLMDTYRLLITKDCPCEGVIQRDIARTFPAHDFFKEAGGLGQDSLLRLARAYAVHDAEVGYCQGLSFVAATLLLHMPEEQAFCVLVRLMYGYGLRELYKDGFEVLTLRLYQLHRLMEEQMSDLRAHFAAVGVEPHMFASQWFLTVFTARFPLALVYHIMDVFLLQGTDTLFQVALALLHKSKKDLMQLDFEGILKYFRVTLPKKCRNEEVSRHIMKQACSIKVKRLHKYQQDFENLTKEVTESEQLGNELERLKNHNDQLLGEKQTIQVQMNELREELRRETERSVMETSRNAAILKEYKEICSRLDRQLTATKDAIKGCISCNGKLDATTDNRTADARSSPDSGDTSAEQRVRELELELARVKLAHVEAQCSNQELMHQLGSAVADYQAALQNQKQSWPPWLSRTLGSIKEAAQNTRPSFQTYLPNLAAGFATPETNYGNQHSAMRRQDSFPLTNLQHSEALSRRDSDPAHSPKQMRKKRHSMLADYNKSCEAENSSHKNLTRHSHHSSISGAYLGNPSVG